MSKSEKAVSISCLVFFISICIVMTIIGSIFLVFLINWPHNSGHCFDSVLNISRDRDFEKNGFIGEGTIDDPYRLENTSFHIEGYYGICIQKTKAHFVIRNCTISGGSHSLNLENIKAGTATIENNTFVYDSYSNICINLKYSPKTTIIYNIFRPNKNITSIGSLAIDLDISDYCLIKENTFSNIGIGLNIYKSKNLLIEDNVFINNANGIFTYLGQQFNLINNQFINSSFCLSIEYCSDIGIFNNCIINSSRAIYLENSSFCLISDCILENNTEGIIIENSENNHIESNLIQFSLYYGIKLLSSSNCIINRNNLIDNHLNGTDYDLSQAYDDQDAINPTLRNYWFNSLFNEGNFWSDLEWSEGVIYEIDGGDSIDPYPLENPVVI